MRDIPSIVGKNFAEIKAENDAIKEKKEKFLFEKFKFMVPLKEDIVMSSSNMHNL